MIRGAAVPLKYQQVAAFQPCLTVPQPAKENPMQFDSAGHFVMALFLTSLNGTLTYLSSVIRPFPSAATS
jgi:hypothetical protein